MLYESGESSKEGFDSSGSRPFCRQVAFKRIKALQPDLSMTQINKLVAEEWQTVKASRVKQQSVGSLNAEVEIGLRSLQL
jgi:hypothetical protein